MEDNKDAHESYEEVKTAGKTKQKSVTLPAVTETLHKKQLTWPSVTVLSYVYYCECMKVCQRNGT